MRSALRRVREVRGDLRASAGASGCHGLTGQVTADDGRGDVVAPAAKLARRFACSRIDVAAFFASRRYAARSSG